MAKADKLESGDSVKVEVAGVVYDAVVTDPKAGLCTFSCVGPKGDESAVTVSYKRNKPKAKPAKKAKKKGK